MQRRIAGFHRDEEHQWVAELDCGHGQHVRHDPPFVERAWTQSEDGRASRLGTELDCVRCDRREMPDGFAPYRRTPSFTEATIPAALCGRHSTKRGVWACIHVVRGQLAYRVFEPFGTDETLDPDTLGIVVAEVEHAVKPLGEVEFFVEFWRAAQS